MIKRKDAPLTPFIYLTIFILSLSTQIFAALERQDHYEKFFYIQGGPKYMYYFATFDVGTPQVLQSAIIDTGSDTMAFPCESCHGKNCGSHQYPRFRPDKSSSFKYKIRCSNPHRIGGHVVCKFVKSYAEGSSLYGFLANDLIRFKDAKRVHDVKLTNLNRKLVKDVRMTSQFGCTEKETGLFKTQYADGILGLDDNSEFISSMEALNGGSTNVLSFGLCFHEHGGIMSIDLRKKYEKDDKIRMLNKQINEYQKPLIIPYDSSNMYYEIPLYSFSLGNDKINLDVPATIMIDSGTTFSHFPNLIMHQVLRELNKWCSKSLDRCGKIPKAVFKDDSCLELRPPDENYDNEDELLNSFPDFHLYLGQRRSYRLRPKNYFYKEYLEDAGERNSGLVRLCMAIKGHSDDKIILGAFAMVDHYFYFDRKSHKLKIFRENCFLRTGSLMDSSRILSASSNRKHSDKAKHSLPVNNIDDQIIHLEVSKKHKTSKDSKISEGSSDQERELYMEEVHSQEVNKQKKIINPTEDVIERLKPRHKKKFKHSRNMYNEESISNFISFLVCCAIISYIVYVLISKRNNKQNNQGLENSNKDKNLVKEETDNENVIKENEQTMTNAHCMTPCKKEDCDLDIENMKTTEKIFVKAFEISKNLK